MQLIGSSGNYYENSGVSLSWSLGETVTETVSDGSNFLNQGFQQEIISVSTLIKKSADQKPIVVYPNPVHNTLVIESEETNINYQLMDLNGKIVFDGKIVSEFEKINFTKLPNGAYILKINNKETHKIFKQ